MYTEFKNKVVLVTGGSSGIGAACVHAFSEEGATVIIASRDSAKANKVMEKVEKNDGAVDSFKADLSEREEIKKLFDYISKKYKHLDYAVNNAGIEGAAFTKTQNYPEKIWDDVINLNLTAVWLCLKYELSLMLKQSSGSIVNVSSIAGLQASLTGGSAYTASKHGVIGITKSAALEYAEKGIRVNAICPAIIHTELTEQVLGDKIEDAHKLHPIGRMGFPSEVADTVLWLCSDKASFVTAVALPVDGGIMG